MRPERERGLRSPIISKPDTRSSRSHTSPALLPQSMTLLVEFELSTPLLRQARQTASDIELQIESISQSFRDMFKLIF